MKKAKVSILGMIFCFTIFVGVSFAADKFAYVDISKVFTEYNKTREYDKVLLDKENTYSTEREKKVSEIKDFQNKLNLLSEKEKETKKSDLEGRVKSLQDFDRQKQTDLRKEQDEKMKDILKDIDVMIKQYAEKEGYTLVFHDKALVYQSKNLDITDKILEGLNKGYKK
jgi:Skp family chaperone for outer membrane proteins